MILHGYWRSTTAYRVRIALALKGVAYDQVNHDLRTGAQRDADYLALNPQGLVPALEVDGRRLTQSPAILEWLEATYPEPPLLPPDAIDAAIVRSIAATIGCDIHPVNNLRILDTLRHELGASAEQVSAWIARWITDGFVAIETIVARHGAGFAFGASPTLADCYLVPQAYAAERYSVDMSHFPQIAATVARARLLPAFQVAHPDRQGDADTR